MELKDIPRITIPNPPNMKPRNYRGVVLKDEKGEPVMVSVELGEAVHDPMEKEKRENALIQKAMDEKKLSI